MTTLLAIGKIVMGVAIAGIWSRDIIAGEAVDLSAGFFRARDEDSGGLFWPHWLAEFTTAGFLIVGGAGLLGDASWAATTAAIALGALLYTSTNALGWALAQRDRYPYAIPMILGDVVAIGGVIVLLTR